MGPQIIRPNHARLTLQRSKNLEMFGDEPTDVVDVDGWLNLTSFKMVSRVAFNGGEIRTLECLFISTFLESHQFPRWAYDYEVLLPHVPCKFLQLEDVLKYFSTNFLYVFCQTMCRCPES